ncbi:MAG: excinuclease ABC subunit C [Bacteroidia bacterium]|nr:excinuclease ABC subunit C [Bacteroidia bacterium]
MANLKEVIQNIPHEPGIYKYFDKEGTIIYVGKAKNLRKRVSSYFTKSHNNGKTRVLVSKIANIEIIIVANETEALLLENSLIKQHQPRYNMMLKDDKSFPLIRVTNERFPRIFAMRNPKYDGSQFYGPYTSAKSMYIILDLIKSIYPLRNCNYNLSEENIEAGKFKACLEYQIGNCNAPCIGKETEEAYMASIRNVKNILRGNFSSVKNHLKENMLLAAEELKFEEADKYKRRMELLEMFRNRSTVVSHTITNVDVFSAVVDGNRAFVNFIKVVNGMVIQAKSVEYKLKMNESMEEVLAQAIPEFRQKYKSDAKEIIVPLPLDMLNDVKQTVPKAGDKKKLLDLSVRNALLYKKQKLDQYEKLNPGARVDRLMDKMKQDLRLTEEPRHIECFDNSNLQGTNPVSACVVFKDGKPSKKDYRHFNIKTVIGPNDFDSMKEVVHRRYTRLVREERPLPQLIVIDGGKGQLSSVVETLKEINLYGQIAVVGIAKRLEEIYYPEDSLPMYIDKTSETLKVIQHMRDEAHRFGITHHRNQRSKGLTRTELSAIDGIGPKTAQALLSRFKSVKKIKNLSLDDLTRELGPSKAQLIYDYFHKKD